jgi:glycosyltransferase involved in cell wall biosynthesis
MLKVLLLIHKLPYPPVSGGAIKRWKLIQYLSANCDLSIAAVCSDKDLQWKDVFLSQINPSSFFCATINRQRNLWNLIKSYLENVPLSIYRNSSETFKQHVARIASQYEVIFVDSYLMLQYVPADYEGKVVLHEHNAEYVIWERFAKIENNIFKKLAVSLEAGRIRRYQQTTAKKARVILAASHDIAALERIGIESSKFLETFHFGDERLLELPDIEFETTEKALLHVGALDWEPNADGLIWFMESAWSLLKRQHPSLKLYVVGKNPTRKLQALAIRMKDVVLTGFVENLEEYYTRCRVFIAPLRFGSGMKVKIINAMYRGIPSATTPIGAEGLEAGDGRHLMIADDLRKMVEDINVLLTQKETWKHLRDNSRSLAKDKYRWERVYATVAEALQLEPTP